MESQSGKPSTRRLVIRVKLPKGSPPAPVRRRMSRGALLLIAAGAVAVLLSWVGINMFRAAPTSAPAPSEAAPAPVVSDEPSPKPATQAVETKSPEIAPKVLEQPDAVRSPINEVIPDVPRSARQTIRGTIRVSIRVIVDKGGAVLLATTDEPGPSRYFERLSLEASRKWTFAPQDSAEQRSTLVRFYFTRAGTTARAKPLEACKSC